MILSGLAALTLAACGPRPMPDIRSQISRTQIEARGTPLMLVELPALGVAGTMAPSGRNGRVTTWRTADNVSFAFDDGILVATRGLGNDLMSADVTGTRAALAGGPGQYERFHSYLDGEGQTVLRAFICTMSAPVSDTITILGRSRITQRHDERCNSLGLATQNTYWTAGGTMWATRQWVGPVVETVATERLVE